MRTLTAFTGIALTFGAVFFAAQAANAQSLSAGNFYLVEHDDGSTAYASDFDTDNGVNGSTFTSISEEHGYGYSASFSNGILGAQAVAGQGSYGEAAAMRGDFTIFSEAGLDIEIDQPVEVQVWSDATWETTVTNTTDTALDYTFIFHVYGPSLQTSFDSGEASVYLNIYSNENNVYYSAYAGLNSDGLAADAAFGSWHYSEYNNYYYADSFDASLSIGTIGAGESFTIVYGMGAYALATDMDFNSFAYIGDPFNWGWGPEYQVITKIIPGDPTSGIPEPASWALLIAGFGLIGTALRRRRPLEA